MSDILYREVDVPCEPERAWEHVIDPSWLGDDGSLAAVPGGEGWVASGDETRYLVVEEVDAGRRFAFRWASFVDEPSRVEIDLEPTTVGTRITIRESPLESRDRMCLAAR